MIQTNKDKPTTNSTTQTNHLDKIIKWLDDLKGPRAMAFVFCWMFIPTILTFMALFASMFSATVAIILIILALFVFIVMTIGILLKIVFSTY